MKEIERKYLMTPDAVQLLDKYSSKCVQLEQFYTKVTENKSVRFRKDGSHYFKTVKEGTGGIRKEDEKEVSAKTYRKNLAKRIGKVIYKRRCLFQCENHIYSLDIYEKDLEDLLILEVEFRSERQYEAFTLPEAIAPFVEKEVTDDEVYKNKNLALFGLPVDENRAIDILLYRLRVLFEKIEKYGDRVLEDQNEEDLHKLRVALRTSISLLKSCRFLCQPEKCDYHRKHLKEIIQVTNQRRDFDVLQVQLNALAKEIRSHEMQSAVVKLHSIIENVNSDERETIVEFLKSSKYGTILTHYEKFLEKGFIAARSMYAMYDGKRVCSYVIFRQYQKISKQIEAIGTKYDDIAILHKLRIEFKQLRYMLENFGELYENADKLFLKDVKKLQTVLGKFHDIDRQKVIFMQIREKIEENDVLFLLDNIILPKLKTHEVQESVKVQEKLKHFLDKKPLYRQVFAKGEGLLEKGDA